MKREEMKLTERRKVRVGGSGCGHFYGRAGDMLQRWRRSFAVIRRPIEFAPTPVRALAGLQAT